MTTQIPAGSYVRIGRRNKYRNVKVELDGYVFRSKKEAGVYEQLRLRKMAKEIRHFEVAPTYYVYGHKVKGRVELWFQRDKISKTFTDYVFLFSYTPDFVVYPTADYEFWDVKGMKLRGAEAQRVRMICNIFKAQDVEVKIIR
jgi:hypothetical protein